MDWKKNTFSINFPGDDDEFRIFKKHVSDKKIQKKISYWNRNLKTCQILKLNVFNVSDSELKTFQRVSFRTEVITQQVIGFQIKFFESCQRLNFDFIDKQSVFAEQRWHIKKIESFYLCTNGNFCIPLALLRCTIETESFLKTSFWVETSKLLDSGRNDFQRVKFKNTISKIPRILDWVFYNVPDFELIFLWGRNNLEKNIGWKRISFWFIFSKKKTTILSVCLKF